MELYDKYKTLFSKYEVDTSLRKSHFMAQIDHESQLKPITENLYYTTIKALRGAFYTPFKGKSDSFVSQYLKSPQKLANYVYANRGGNGNVASEDGYKYRGRGFIQTTLKNNYSTLSRDTKIDYLNNPDWLLREPDAMIAALEYWRVNSLNKYADLDDIDSISDIINKGKITKVYGDANGFEDRVLKLKKWKRKLGL